MKKFFESDLWLLIKILLIVAALAVIISGVVSLLHFTALADGETTDVWVLCDPDSFVCVREHPRKSSYAFGGVTCGVLMHTDGKTQKSYLHVVDVHAEEDTGWISSQHIVYDEPVYLHQEATVVSNGRLAARAGVNGKVRKWLQPMDTLTILYWSSEWCLTNYGYVQTDYLELNGAD